MEYRDKIQNLFAAALKPDVEPNEAAEKLDEAYGLFKEKGEKVDLPEKSVNFLLASITYGYVSDSVSAGAASSRSDSIRKNPRLKRFKNRFDHIVEITGIEADWDKYFGESIKKYKERHKSTSPFLGEKTLRASKLGAPGKQD